MIDKFECTTFEGIIAFQSLDSIQRRSLSRQLKTRTYAEGEFVVQQAESERDVYFIISGKIRASVFSINGKEIQYEDLHAGEMFGELAALDGLGRASDCIALEDSYLAVMPQTDFLSALDTYSGFNRFVMRRLAIMLRTNLGRVFEFSAHTVKDRLRFQLYRMALRYQNHTSGDIVIANAPTHADMAARISTHREAVTRELKQLEAAGVITWRPGKHVIHNLIALTDQS